MALTSEQARNALNTVINQRAESMIAHALQQVDEKLASVAGKVVIANEQPSVEITNEVNPTPITNNVDVAGAVITVDTRPIAEAIADMSNAFIAALRQIGQDNAVALAQLAESLKNMPTPEIKIDATPPAPATKREIEIIRQGDKMTVRER